MRNSNNAKSRVNIPILISKIDMSAEDNKDTNSVSENSSDIAATWNENEELFLKSTSERANCMRWMHNQCNLHFDNLNFYFTIPNVIISTLNGSLTMSLNSMFPDPGAQRYATTVIGLVSILSAVLITMNQYVKSQQMMESHRAAGLAYGKLHRMICNELAVRRDQRSNAIEFLKIIKAEQDRLESTSPNILPSVIMRFNRQFIDRNIEKPEIAGDLDATEVNTDMSSRRKDNGKYSPTLVNRIGSTMKKIGSFSGMMGPKRNTMPRINPEETREHSPENTIINMMMENGNKKNVPPFALSIKAP